MMPLTLASHFWAKLGKRGLYPADAHPVICHLMDVGKCCGGTLVAVSQGVSTQQRWARELSLVPGTG